MAALDQVPVHGGRFSCTDLQRQMPDTAICKQVQASRGKARSAELASAASLLTCA